MKSNCDITFLSSDFFPGHMAVYKLKVYTLHVATLCIIELHTGIYMYMLSNCTSRLIHVNTHLLIFFNDS